MKNQNKAIGFCGEDLAVNYLIKSGYLILNKNFICRIGEIDIIAKDKNYICFIEVKTRYNKTYGLPSEAVNFKKQLKIYNCAKYYILKNKLNYKIKFRFDVVEILFNYTNNSYKINLIKNAFQI